ncbi:MAG: DUF502 domain-containing protein, partial [Chloroflexi bacterium]|nr:DUF502 domain-containing protein [Chloroflexota bacterium]
FVFGILGAKVLGRQLIRLWESMVQKPPLIRHIYSAVKQIIDSFTSKEKGGFRQVVIVEFPRRDMWTLGLITSESIDPNGQLWVSLYIPTPPNPTGGFFAILREEEVIRTKIPIDLGLKIIISSGKLTEDVVFKHLAEYREEMEKRARRAVAVPSECSPLTEREIRQECTPLGVREPAK